jgi:hypothetical protein
MDRPGPLAVVAVSVFAAVLSLSASSKGAARTSGVSLEPNGSLSQSWIRTAMYNRSGKYLCAVYRWPHGWWGVEHGSAELWIQDRAGRLEADFTHHLDGWARPVAPGRWNMVAAVNDAGPYRFYGRIIRRPSNRWSFSNTTGHVLGYTVGPDGPAAGTAALIFLWHDSTGC